MRIFPVAGSNPADRTKRTGPIPGNLKQYVMAKLKVTPDNETFHWNNVNPKNRRTGDCVTRAIAAFLGQSWEQTYRELAEYGLKHATAMNCPETYVPFLASKGYEKHKMPRTACGTKYTGKEFCRKIAEPGTCYVVAMANHLTFIAPDCRINDIWDCGDKCVGNYWSRELL